MSRIIMCHNFAEVFPLSTNSVLNCWLSISIFPWNDFWIVHSGCLVKNLNIRKDFFTLRVTKHYHRLSRELCSLHHWRCLEVVWTWSWEIGCGWESLFEQGDWTRCPLEVPSKLSHSPLSDPVQCMHEGNSSSDKIFVTLDVLVRMIGSSKG